METIPYRHQSSSLVYSGQDRHSFGLRPVTEVQTPRDKGPWPWDRTGTAADIDPKPLRSGPKKGFVRSTGTTAQGRAWVLAMEPGKQFRSKDLFAALGLTKNNANSVVQGVFRTLLDAQRVEKLGPGLWRRV